MLQYHCVQSFALLATSSKTKMELRQPSSKSYKKVSKGGGAVTIGCLELEMQIRVRQGGSNHSDAGGDCPEKQDGLVSLQQQLGDLRLSTTNLASSCEVQTYD